MERNELRQTLRQRFPRERSQLLPALHYLQEEFGHLPGWAMEVVGWHLRVPASEVYGSATSYTELRTEEPGAHLLRVCTGLSCWMNGGRELLDTAFRKLGVQPGEAAGDSTVTLEESPCGFMCGVAPVVEWDGRWHGRATGDTIAVLVDGGDL